MPNRYVLVRPTHWSFPGTKHHAGAKSGDPGPGYDSLADQIQDHYAKKAPNLPWGLFATIDQDYPFDIQDAYLVLGVQTMEWVEIASPALPRGVQVVTSGLTVLAADTPVAVRVASHR